MAEKEGEKLKEAESPRIKDIEYAKSKPGGPARSQPPIDSSGSRMDVPLAVGEIAILLDTYDDIFSDFDPRPYEQRELSEDFLKELNRRHLENKKGGFEMRLLIPANEREPKYEAIIKKRLREHFQYELHELDGQLKHRQKRGLHHVFIGFVLLISETVLALLYPDSLWLRLVSLVLVPGGWFYAWTGMELLLEEPFSVMSQRSFYEKFVKCNYLFVTQDPEGD